MDTQLDRMKRRNPGPWRFYVRRYGLVHVIADANGEPIASSVPIGAGPLLAAGPELLAALERVVELAPVGSLAHNVAVDALEQFAERRHDARRLAAGHSSACAAAAAHCGGRNLIYRSA